MILHNVIVGTEVISGPLDHAEMLERFYAENWGQGIGCGIEYSQWLNSAGMTAIPYVEPLPYDTDAIRQDNGLHRFNVGFSFADKAEADAFRSVHGNAE